MTSNPIIDELHRVRSELLAESGGTLKGLVADLQKRQQASGREILLPPTKPLPAAAQVDPSLTKQQSEASSGGG
ncbi:hypothetical protein Pla123a_06340 [Posidoniimonas polymericola]|uniref:Uncharacterized protein n=1 Tax=Posidoniimonas polymericola TaxID=2528002 RepID=A0A5C5ZFN1_9BACT|nr:hypothetical protein [Posidoniimonas polymericola]TWT85827.1 hypothetical protein Pla123a_06340 [Posidoniimonas polymericola]